ncbi:1-acyl-sn-glycerol-3-phosphate acyltransferase [Oceaniovalibus sp. ACAM 378]|uniref:lysophospholipid acyltransferase family protein n=1 Tax=Oceaniovalibus sp. ACAM 378 TaxID=2599923 RepID=UPI0011DB442A|nr:lysophospholipid acyltransferase family protein [Oceaniovalibus sp. ACAM 378]TYB89825.1 1-acyl-sn-glycerol-3-phosphate acyltransferase [Oceaniovalibus sp. ACAM 378]
MSPTWDSDSPPEPLRLGVVGWALVGLRGVMLGAVVFGGLAILLLARLVERPLSGDARPVTPWITRGVCRVSFVILGIRYRVHGRPMQGRGAVVANHSSWLDIFALNAADRVYFVSKSEVAGWPAIGWLARATGTLFIRRDPREAAKHRDRLAARLLQGHRMLFFPEGTSTDGKRVLPFKSTLFGSFFADDLRDVLQIQPVTVIYAAPAGQEPRFYGWWGDMDFGTHLLKILGAVRQGRVDVMFHPPVPVSGFANRKTIAGHLGGVVAMALIDVEPKA